MEVKDSLVDQHEREGSIRLHCEMGSFAEQKLKNPLAFGTRGFFLMVAVQGLLLQQIL